MTSTFVTEEAERVMKALDAHGPMNKEELSLAK